MSTVSASQLTTSRDQAASWIRQFAGNIKSIRASLKQPENEQFYNCVCGKGSGCNSAQAYDFTLYDALGGNNPAKMYFDRFGNPCDKAASNCLVEIKTSFMAQCLPTLPSGDPTPPASCVGVPAEFVAILYTVHQNPLTVNRGYLLKSITGSVYTGIDKIAPVGSGVCP